MKRYLPSKMTLLLSFVISLAAALFILYVAFEHNPQNEFYDQLIGINWKNSLSLGLSSLLLASIFIFPTLYIMEKLWKADAHLLKGTGVDDRADRAGSVDKIE